MPQNVLTSERVTDKALHKEGPTNETWWISNTTEWRYLNSLNLNSLDSNSLNSHSLNSHSLNSNPLNSNPLNSHSLNSNSLNLNSSLKLSNVQRKLHKYKKKSKYHQIKNIPKQKTFSCVFGSVDHSIVIRHKFSATPSQKDHTSFSDEKYLRKNRTWTSDKYLTHPNEGTSLCLKAVCIYCPSSSIDHSSATVRITQFEWLFQKEGPRLLVREEGQCRRRPGIPEWQVAENGVGYTSQQLPLRAWSWPGGLVA